MKIKKESDIVTGENKKESYIVTGENKKESYIVTGENKKESNIVTGEKLWLDRGSNPGPFGDRANTLPLSYRATQSQFSP